MPCALEFTPTSLLQQQHDLARSFSNFRLSFSFNPRGRQSGASAQHTLKAMLLLSRLIGPTIPVLPTSPGHQEAQGKYL